MPASRSSSGTSNRSARPRSATGKRGTDPAARQTADAIANFIEQLTNRILRPLGIVMLTRERIQETLDEAAARGRLTRSDANELATELVNRGREQTDELLSELERLFGRGRMQLESVTKLTHLTDPVDRIARTADRARQTIGAGPPFPIADYDDLTARQVQERLTGLSPGELRKLREYELRHANRKSVLAAIEHLLA